MDNMDLDLRSIQEARDLCKYGSAAAERIAKSSEDQIDKILQNMSESQRNTRQNWRRWL